MELGGCMQSTAMAFGQATSQPSLLLSAWWFVCGRLWRNKKEEKRAASVRTVTLVQDASSIGPDVECRRGQFGQGPLPGAPAPLFHVSAACCSQHQPLSPFICKVMRRLQQNKLPSRCCQMLPDAAANCQSKHMARIRGLGSKQSRNTPLPGIVARDGALEQSHRQLQKPPRKKGTTILIRPS